MTEESGEKRLTACMHSIVYQKLDTSSMYADVMLISTFKNKI